MSSQPLYLTPQQVREFDRLAVEELGIPSIILMENAGRNAAEIIDRWMTPRAVNTAIIVCGVGNNGGDGFVIARHLANRGRMVRLFQVGTIDGISPDCRMNRDIALAMGLPVLCITTSEQISALNEAMASAVMIVDAMLGTGFFGSVREPMDAVIKCINEGRKVGVVAVDVPSGLDAATGDGLESSVLADLTVTFVAMKTGFQTEAARRCLGKIEVVDIGAPLSLIDRILS